MLLLAAVLSVAGAGCQSATDRNSISFVGFPCNFTTAPLAGDFSRCTDVQGLKKGTSSSVVFFHFYWPLVTVGDEAVESAMRNGGISELYYADYSSRYFLIAGWYTVTAYGK